MMGKQATPGLPAPAYDGSLIDFPAITVPFPAVCTLSPPPVTQPRPLCLLQEHCVALKSRLQLNDMHDLLERCLAACAEQGAHLPADLMVELAATRVLKNQLLAARSLLQQAVEAAPANMRAVVYLADVELQCGNLSAVCPPRPQPPHYLSPSTLALNPRGNRRATSTGAQWRTFPQRPTRTSTGGRPWLYKSGSMRHARCSAPLVSAAASFASLPTARRDRHCARRSSCAQTLLQRTCS